jgi:hypothetical protein
MIRDRPALAAHAAAERAHEHAEMQTSTNSRSRANASELEFGSGSDDRDRDRECTPCTATSASTVTGTSATSRSTAAASGRVAPRLGVLAVDVGAGSAAAAGAGTGIVQQGRFEFEHSHSTCVRAPEYYMASPLVCPRLMSLPEAGGDRTRFVYDSPSCAYDGAERSRSIAQADEGIGPHVHLQMHPAFRFENDPADTVANAFERLPNSGATSDRVTADAQLEAVVSKLHSFDLEDEAQRVRGRGSLVKWRKRSYTEMEPPRAADGTKKEGSASTGAAAS